jgi:hypothetical protein
MAYLAQDDKQNQDQNQQDQGSAGSSGAPVVGNSAGAGSVSTAGMSAGGGGAWTNIQSYLNANKGNTGSANLLNQQVGNTFNQESQNEKSQAQDAKNQSDQVVSQNKLGQDQASKMVEQLGGMYQNNKPQSADYTNQINQLHSQLYGNYSGPSQFNYALGGQAQQYGTNLGNDQGFTSVMNDLYQKNAPGMGSGGLALQQQLDTNNDAVQNARQNLLAQYSGLQSNIKSDIDSTNQALQANAKQYGENQASDRDYFQNNLAKQYRDKIDEAVGHENRIEDTIASGHDMRLTDNPGMKHHVQLSKWLGGPSAYSTVDIDPNEFLSYHGSRATENNLASVDPERNRFNTIADILGNSGSKIQRDAEDYKHGGYAFDEDKARKWYNQNISDWDFGGAVD